MLVQSVVLLLKLRYCQRGLFLSFYSFLFSLIYFLLKFNFLCFFLWQLHNIGYAYAFCVINLFHVCVFQVGYFSSLGGSDPGDCIRRIMRKIGTNLVWSHFSHCGQKKKKKMSDMKITDVIKSNLNLLQDFRKFYGLQQHFRLKGKQDPKC